MTGQTQELKIYVVDDDPHSCRALELLLASEGFGVETFPSGEEILQRNLPPADEYACLILDVRLPGVSGPELYRILSERGVRVPVIFFTAYPDARDAVHSLRHGAVDYLCKPVSKQRVLEAVHSAAQLAREWSLRAALARRIDAVIDSLSPREREVLGGTLKGLESKEISAKLGIGVKTVLRYRARVFEKFAVSNAVELLLLFQKAGKDFVVPDQA
jgi:FixJ family two-component response regulator